MGSLILGLTGYAQSGKDSVAKILVEKHGYKRIAFADKIRDLLYKMDPYVKGEYHLKILVDAYGWEIVKQTPEVRRMLQNLGMAAREAFGDTFWIDQALSNLHSFENYVVTDVRFANEATKIQFIGGRLWRIKRPGVEAVNEHISESDMDGYKVDQILMNRGTLEDLEELVNERCLLN